MKELFWSQYTYFPFAVTTYRQIPTSFFLDCRSLTNGGCSALYTASEHGHTEVARILLEAGADPRQTEDADGWTPMHAAAAWNNADVIRLLASFSASGRHRREGRDEVDEADDDGDDEEEDGERLTEMRDKSRATPLHAAAGSGHLEAAEALISAGAEVNAAEEVGWTPLHWSAEKGYDNVVALLLSSGADVNSRKEFFHKSLRRCRKCTNLSSNFLKHLWKVP